MTPQAGPFRQIPAIGTAACLWLGCTPARSALLQTTERLDEKQKQEQNIFGGALFGSMGRGATNGASDKI